MGKLLFVLHKVNIETANLLGTIALDDTFSLSFFTRDLTNFDSLSVPAIT